jgi:hypothetical protein
VKNPWLCLIIVATLGVTVVLGTAGLVVLSLYHVDAPQALVAVVTGALGSLASFLVQPPRGSIGIPQGQQQE